MNITKIGKICGDQDGAVFSDFLFRFNASGDYSVYNLKNLDFSMDNGDVAPIYSGKLDRFSEIVPHSNATFFGSNYYEDGDEFPILYSNLYNNYANDETKNALLLCYRVKRDGSDFTTSLIGEIKIGFKDERNFWRSSIGEDVRPYGNFVSDKNSSKLYAFVMIDKENITRYFSFNMPDINKGEMNEVLGIKSITLNKSDIIECFDAPYHRYIQGGCLKENNIYSTEGFSNDAVQIPAIRIISTEGKEQIKYVNLPEYGYYEEPEFIDFYGDICLYSDAHGNLYRIIW